MTTHKQKFLLFLLSIVLLEGILQTIGYSYSFLQSNITEAAEHPDQKVILCIGDSTTAFGLNDSYPSVLQQKLNQLYGEKKYRVVNAGAPAKSSLYLLESLEEKIQSYKPDYIITMLGFNDFLLNEQSPSFIDNFKIYKFFKLLKLNLFYREAQPDFDVVKDLNASESRLWNLAVTSSEAGRKQESNNYFSELIKRRSDPRVYVAVARYYVNHYPANSPEIQYALEYVKKSLQIDPYNIGTLHFTAQILKNQLKRIQEAEGYLLKANALMQCHLGVTMGLAEIYTMQNKYNEAIETLKKCSASNDEGAHDLSRRLIALLMQTGKISEAQDYLLQAKKRFPNYTMLSLLEYKLSRQAHLSPDSYDEALAKNFLANNFTIENYQSIATVIQNHQIKHIVMQYPLREIQSLKDILKSFKNITYIQNIDNFNSALQIHGYDDLFFDKAGQDFGHATRLGNEVIVDQIIKTLVSEKVL